MECADAQRFFTFQQKLLVASARGNVWGADCSLSLSLSIPLAEAKEEEPLMTLGAHITLEFDESGDGSFDQTTELFTEYNEIIYDAYQCISKWTEKHPFKRQNLIHADRVYSECPYFAKFNEQQLIDFYDYYSKKFPYPPYSCTIVSHGNFTEGTIEVDKKPPECDPERYEVAFEGLKKLPDVDKFQATEGGYKFTMDLTGNYRWKQKFFSEFEDSRSRAQIEADYTITMPTNITDVTGNIDPDTKVTNGRTAHFEITDDTAGEVNVLSEAKGHPTFDAIQSFVLAVLAGIISTLIIAVVSKTSKKTKVNKSVSKQTFSPTADLTLTSPATLVWPLSAGATPAQSLPQAYQLEQFNQGQNQAPSDTSSTWTQPMMPPMQTQQTTYKHPQENKILALTILGAFFYLPAPFAWAKAHRAKKEMRAMNLQPSQNIKVCSIISMVYTSFIPICIIFILKLLLALDSSTDSAMVLFDTIAPLLLHI